MRIILNTSVCTVKRLRISMGTFVAVEATSGSAAAAEGAVEAAFAAIRQVDERMHPRQADSDLARINNAPLHTPVRVHPSVCELLSLARRINTLTDGVFDPCLPTRRGRLRDIEMSGDEVVCYAPVALDFGGFAKGYAVDCAIEALQRDGCSAGLVNAGGDLRVFGSRTEPLFLRGTAGELASVELIDAALAVSDADSQRRPAEHQGYYVRDYFAASRADAGAANHDHAEAPRSLPVRYATVIAKQAVIADALAKCVLLCPMPMASHVLQVFGARQAYAALASPRRACSAGCQPLGPAPDPPTPPVAPARAPDPPAPPVVPAPHLIRLR